MLRTNLTLLLGLGILAMQPVALSAADNTPQPIQRSAPWQNLFDGQTLNGWVQRGGQAKYAVVDGMIVGTTVANTPNSFLCTEKLYGNFVLELEFLDNPKLNSGVQIRSECFDKEQGAVDYRGQPVKNAKGEPIKVAAGRVHGYQVEIDPSERAWSGGIYDEGRRMWLVDLKNNEAGRKAFKQGEWNRYRIEAVGPQIRVWLNGALTADLKDDVTPRGFIALQVHTVGKDKTKEGIQIKFRNVRLQNLDTTSH